MKFPWGKLAVADLVMGLPEVIRVTMVFLEPFILIKTLLQNAVGVFPIFAVLNLTRLKLHTKHLEI